MTGCYARVYSRIPIRIEIKPSADVNSEQISIARRMALSLLESSSCPFMVTIL